MRHEESYHQKMVVNYVRNKYPGVFLTCSPAVAKSPRQGRENKLMGYRPGTPDLLLLEPMKGYYGLFIEMKTETGKISPDQTSILEQLNNRGYKAIICRGAEMAISAIDKYLKG